MRNKKALGILLVAVLFLVGTISLQGKEYEERIDPDLLATIDNLAPDEMVRVIIRMEEQADVSLQMDSELVKQSLQDVAKTTQKPVLDYLEDQKQQGKVVEYNSFWLVNVAFAEISANLVDELAQKPGVEYIYEDFEITIPDNVEFSKEQDIGTWNHIETTYARELWDMGIKGQDITVAVTDTGVDITHPELADAMGGEPPYYEGYWVEIDSAGNEVPGSTPYDTDYHGTHVSGTAVGRNVNYEIGMAPEATLSHVLLLPGGGGSFPQILGGLQWVADQGHEVANASWGADGIHEDLAVATDNLRAAGVFFVSSAGNYTLGAPGNTPSTFGVGAYQEDGTPAVFNVGGIVEYPGYEYDEYTRIKPDIAGPGVNVWSTMPGGSYGSASGTSMSSPHVAGAAALLLSYAPHLDWEELREVMTASVNGHEEFGWEGQETKDTIFGWGRLNVLAGLEELPPPGPQGMVEGTVLSDYEYIEGARVYFSGPENRVFETDGDGKFSGELQAGYYQVIVEADAYLTVTDEVLIVEQDQKILNYYMEPAPLGSITGKIEDALTGEPLAGVNVNVPGTNKQTETDADGMFSLELKEAYYDIIFSREGYFGETHEDIRVIPGQAVQLDGEMVFGNSTFAGTVFDEETQNPLDGVQVTVIEAEKTYTTGVDGNFSLDLEAGTYTVELSRSGYLDITDEIEITHGEIVVQDYEMEETTGSLAGTVKDTAGELIEGATVFIPELDEEVETCSDGEYAMEVVPAGTWIVMADHEDYWVQQATVEIEMDEETSQDFFLEEIDEDVVFFDDFLVDNFDEIWDTFEDDTTGAEWHRTDRRAWSGEFSAWHGDPELGDYPNSQDAYMLTEETLSLPYEGFTWSFMLWPDVENNWDFFYAIVEDEEGVIHEVYEHTGRDQEWMEVAIDLDEFVGQDIRIGYYFYSDSIINYEGAYVDDIQINLVYPEEGGKINGQVIEKESGDPLAGARITVIEKADSATENFVRKTSQTVTDSGGNYSLDVPGGTWTVRAEKAPEYYSEEEIVQVIPGEEVEQNFALEVNYPPADVENIQVTEEGDGYVQLTWEPVVEDDLKGYIVYHSLVGEEGTFNKRAVTSATEYRVEDLQNNYTQFFKVKAVDEMGQESLDAEIVEGTPMDQMPSVTGFNVVPRALIRGGVLEINAEVNHPMDLGMEAELVAWRNETVGALWDLGEVAGEVEETLRAVDDYEEPLEPGIYQFVLEVEDEKGQKVSSSPINVAITSPVPEALSFVLINNPFNPGEESQMIEYSVPAPGNIEVQVKTLDNRMVRTLVSEQKEAGNFMVYWDGRDDQGRKVLSGMYVIQINYTASDGETVELYRHSVVIK